MKDDDISAAEAFSKVLVEALTHPESNATGFPLWVNDSLNLYVFVVRNPDIQKRFKAILDETSDQEFFAKDES